VTGTAEAEVLELEIGEVAGGGGCVAHAPDGRVVFVRHSLPGELVRARVTATTTSFLRADAVEILRPSPDRVAPRCPYAGPGRCGGCDFQHVALDAQRRLKAARVTDQLRRLADVDRDVTVEAVAGDQEGLGWRTRVRLGVDQDGRVGFRRHRSHEMELVDHCPVATPSVMATGVFEAEWPGARELEIAVSPDAKGAVVSLDVGRHDRSRLPRLGLGLVVNGHVRQQPGAIHTTVAGFDFRVSPGVFWQVHAGAAAVLVDAVLEALDARPGDHAVDLYAGAGLFSVVVAAAVGSEGRVLAVERNRAACDDAEHNGRALAQLRVKKASITPKLLQQGIGRPDLVVLDPAREGAGKAVMAALASHAPTMRRLVYVSCDPSSFGRDARVMLDAGWTLTTLRAFDIFPMTEHVELVASFEPPVG
jgi:tRNA/tmRNA/rRNA uracil-C5-methylase (TrmA/RlmC/RlmD family)